jgi:hypothetical protein
MLTHGCVATLLLLVVTHCYAHHGRLPVPHRDAANSIWIVRSTMSRHLAFENRRCLETPWWKRCVARRSIAPCRCLDRRGATVSPGGRGWEACCESLAQCGRDLALAPSLPELVSAFAFSIRGRDGFFSPISIATRKPAALLMYATHWSPGCSLSSTRTCQLVLMPVNDLYNMSTKCPHTHEYKS